MVLTRLGNKRKMKEELCKHFPTHKMRIELFFGAGGSFFYLPTPQYAILNDFDDDVTNLYQIILERKEELIHQIKVMPISESLIKHWKKNHESDPLLKSIRFLLLSNFTYLGKGDTLRVGLENTKEILIKNIEPTFLKLQNATILNDDFRNVLKKISLHEKLIAKSECFVYLDPVYLGTTHFYKVPKWTEKDTEDCFKIMSECGMKCAMSEFDHPKVLELSEQYGMNIIPLKERRNINNRRKELLITNYTVDQLSINFN